MTDLETRITTTLRALASSADGFALPPTDHVAVRAERRRRAQRLQIGGATLGLVAALVAVGLTLASIGGDRVPPIGGEDTTSTTTATPGTTTTTTPAGGISTPVTPSTVLPALGDPSAGFDGERWQPTAADRVATLPTSRRYRATAYIAQGPTPGPNELYFGGLDANGRRRQAFVVAETAGEGSGPCGEPTVARVPGPTAFVYGRVCLPGQMVGVSATGLDEATVERLVRSIRIESPTHLDTAGTDLVSVGLAPASSPYWALSYTHPTHPGLQLTSTMEDRYDLVMFAREVGAYRDLVDVDVNGVPALQFTADADRPDGPERTALLWQAEPGLFATIYVEGPSDELPAIARDVVVRPGDQVQRELAALAPPPQEAPGTTTSTTAPGGAPVPGLASIGILPASEGWSPIEYEVIPASVLFETQQYVGALLADGDRPFVSVQVAPRDPQQVCAAGSVGEMRLGSEGMLVGSRCIGETMALITGRLVDRSTLDRLLATLTADAPTQLDTTGTDLVPAGSAPQLVGAVRIRYAHPDGGPGAMVLTSPDDGMSDPLASLRRSMSPKDWDDIDIDGKPALVYRSIVEGNVAWTNLVWRPAPGLLVTIMVSGPTDRLPTLARQLELPPAAVTHREFRTLPTNA